PGRPLHPALPALRVTRSPFPGLRPSRRAGSGEAGPGRCHRSEARRCGRVRTQAMSEAIPGMQEAPPPAEPKDAAVVVLVRMGPRGLETFWLRRGRTVSFAAGFYAFPGGRGDAGGGAVPVEGAGPPDSRLVAAAARELFEETGVLAARGRTPEASTLASARAAVLEGKETFASVLNRLGLQVVNRLGRQVDALDFEPAGRWVTPPFMPTRFDARFFLVEVPPGTRAEVWPGEAAEGSWGRPPDALTLGRGGRAPPPSPQPPCTERSQPGPSHGGRGGLARLPDGGGHPHRVPAGRSPGGAADADPASGDAHQRVDPRAGRAAHRRSRGSGPGGDRAPRQHRLRAGWCPPRRVTLAGASRWWTRRPGPRWWGTWWRGRGPSSSTRPRATWPST